MEILKVLFELFGEAVHIVTLNASSLGALEQDTGWAEQWRDRYYEIIGSADIAPALPLEYTDICGSTEDFYDAADRYMIDNCDFIVAVTAGDEEPDAMQYAKDKNKQIVYFDAQTLDVRQ